MRNHNRPTWRDHWRRHLAWCCSVTSMISRCRSSNLCSILSTASWRKLPFTYLRSKDSKSIKLPKSKPKFRREPAELRFNLENSWDSTHRFTALKWPFTGLQPPRPWAAGGLAFWRSAKLKKASSGFSMTSCSCRWRTSTQCGSRFMRELNRLVFVIYVIHTNQIQEMRMIHAEWDSGIIIYCTLHIDL